MIFYISDLHLDHANILKHCNRPFKDVDEMNKAIIQNWNSVVYPEDEVRIVGDFCMKPDAAARFLPMLNGKKHLITGNHDRGDLRRMYDSVNDYAVITDNGVKVVLFHYPIAEWNGYFRGSVHLFGHIHNSDNETAKIMAKIPNCYNVSADCIGFTPRTLKQLQNYERTGKWDSR